MASKTHESSATACKICVIIDFWLNWESYQLWHCSVNFRIGWEFCLTYLINSVNILKNVSMFFEKIISCFFFREEGRVEDMCITKPSLFFYSIFFHHFVSWVIPFHGFKLFVSFFITSQATNEIFVKYFEIIWIWDKKQNVGSWHFLMIDFSNHCYCSLLYFKYDL